MFLPVCYEPDFTGRTDCWMYLMCQWVGGCGGCHWVPSLVCAIKNRTKRNKKRVEFFVFLLIRPQMQWLLHYVGHWMATSSRCSCTIASSFIIAFAATDYGLRPGQLMHRSIHPSIAIHLITKQNKTKGRKKERKKGICIIFSFFFFFWFVIPFRLRRGF